MNEISVVKRLDGPAARERLATYAHDQWAGCMRHILQSCLPVGNGSKSLIIPSSLVDRWTRLAYTAYPDLPEHEKESDRLEADRILEILDRIPLERT